MKNTSNNPDVYINLNVESTTNIQAWAPVLIEMLKKGVSIIEFLSPVEFNDDRTDILWGTADQSQCGLQIYTTVQELKEHLGFFAERTRQGDIISVWESVSELEDLIDEIAETNAGMNDTARQPEKEIERPTIKEKISNEIKSSSPEELAAELISFAKKEFPDQEDERWISIHRIAEFFWRSKNIEKWNLPSDIELKIEKAEILAKKQLRSEREVKERPRILAKRELESEREVKEKEKLLSLVDPCVAWAKEQGLKKVTEAYVDAFLLDKNIDVSPRTERRALYAMVNTKLERERTDSLSLVDPCVAWTKEQGLKKVTEADVNAFLLEKNIDILLRTKKRELCARVNSIIKSK